MIELMNGYYAEVTNYGYNLVIKKTVKKKNGTEDEVIKPISYHGTLSGVINAAMREMQKNKLREYDTDISLLSALNEIEKVHKVFEKLLKDTVGKYEKVGGEGDA